jgi:hypothetical protein
LIDRAKYLEPDDMPRPEIQSSDLHRLRQGRVTPRPPSLRAMVKWALAADAADQLAERIRRRQAEAELERLLQD